MKKDPVLIVGRIALKGLDGCEVVRTECVRSAQEALRDHPGIRLVVIGGYAECDKATLVSIVRTLHKQDKGRTVIVVDDPHLETQLLGIALLLPADEVSEYLNAIA